MLHLLIECSFRKRDTSLRKISAAEHLQGDDPPVSSGPETIDPTLVDASLSGWFKHEIAEKCEINDKYCFQRNDGEFF